MWRGSRGGSGGAVILAQALPMRMEPRNNMPTGITPPSLCAATAASPMDATQPHEEQSGWPPYWQGVTAVFKSAERTFVVNANTHSFGPAGGVANCRISP